MTGAKWILAALLLAAAAIGGLYAWRNTGQMPETPAPTQEAQEVPPPAATVDAEETEKIRQTAASFLEDAADYSLFFSCLSDPKHGISIHETVPMRSASMIKVFILEYAMERANAGILDLHETVALQDEDKVGGSGILPGFPEGTELSVLDLLRLMITESDNTATNIIIDRLGMEKINRYIAARGYPDTILQRKMMDFEAAGAGHENYTSARDLGTFFIRLYRHQCVNREYDDIMAEILKAQADNEAFPAALPEAVIAHKTGELAGAYHDGGIVYGDKDCVLVILTDDYKDRETAIEAIRGAARYLFFATFRQKE